LNEVDSVAPDAVRLFTFGVGDEVNAVLLDRLARDHRGASAYVRPGQRIDETVSSFYAKVSMPLLSDLRLDFGSVHVEDAYPYPLPDLFAGTQIVMTGRYREGGDTAITLRGMVGEQERTFEFGAVRFRKDGGETFVPRLWATRKVGYLLNQIRLHGESRELVQEIVDLAVQYGIMTPYTSFLIEEDADIFSRGGRQEMAEREYNGLAAQAPAAPSGKAAVDEAECRTALERSDIAAGATGEVVKVVGSKVFLLREGVWTDTAFDVDRMSVVKVGFMSEDYFRLAAAWPEWGAYLSVGERVLVVLPGAGDPTAYMVVDQGAGETIRVPELQQMATPAVTATPTTEAPPPSPVPSPTASAPAGGRSAYCRGAATAMLLALIAMFRFIWRR
jgi:Ca-activated chloride channel family protein